MSSHEFDVAARACELGLPPPAPRPVRARYIPAEHAMTRPVIRFCTTGWLSLNDVLGAIAVIGSVGGILRERELAE